MALTLAYVTPEALRWPRDSSGYTLKDAARRIGVVASRLELAEQGQEYLTLRQAEQAETYERPLAALFLPEPPQVPCRKRDSGGCPAHQRRGGRRRCAF